MATTFMKCLTNLALFCDARCIETISMNISLNGKMELCLVESRRKLTLICVYTLNPFDAFIIFI